MTNFSSLARRQRATQPLATLGLVLATASVAQAQTQAPVATFAPYTTYDAGAGSAPHGLKVADVNGDGKLDVVTVNTGSSTIGVLLGNGDGTFGTATTYGLGLSTGITPLDLAVADMNNDGKLDVLTVYKGSGKGGVGVSLGNGDGTFQVATSYDTNNNLFIYPDRVAVADVTGDGKPDALVSVRGGNKNAVGLLLGNGDGTFQTSKTISAGQPTLAIAVADVNADGKTDVLAGGAIMDPVSVLLSNGDGTFVSSRKSSGTSAGIYDAAVGDLNADGKLDLVVINTVSRFGTLQGDGRGGFQASASFSIDSPVGISLLDVNGDGLTDALIASDWSKKVNFLGGNGTGLTFASYAQYSVGTATNNSTLGGLAVADVNRDGKPDALTVDYSTNQVAVLLNTSAYPAPTLSAVSPGSGPAGTQVTLTGTYLGSATGVSFNGTAATFTVVNATTIRATVPAGATSGNVTVTTPGGTTSGRAFTVPADLVITSPTDVPGGTYNSITVNSPGLAVLKGDVTVLAGVTINNGGGLVDECHVISGAGSFTLAAGGQLAVCNSDGISASGATGAVQVTGTRSFSPDANYGYNGNGPQITGSGLPSQVRNLGIANEDDVTLSQATSVVQTLVLADDGDLVLNGQALTLLSSASGTALIENRGLGEVDGAATIQRYIDPSLNPSTAANPGGKGYRHYSSPVQNTTVADLATTNFTPVLTQSYNTSATPGTTTPFPNVFGYDQSRLATVSSNYSAFDKGWVVPAAATAALVPGQGYAVNIAGTELVDFVGTPNNGDLTVNLSRNADATAADAGWALVGNPYPSPLDYSQLQNLDLIGVDRAMYVQQSTGQYAGQYRSYVNGNSTGGGIRPAAEASLIAAGQGFFVRVSQGETSGSISFSNYQRVTSYDQQTAFQRPAADVRPSVRLELAGAGLADAFVTYAENGATAGFDRQYDAAKLSNPTGLNLSSATATDKLAIDGRPAFTAATVLALNVGVPAAGTYTLTAASLANLPAGLTPSLRDAATGQLTPLTAGSVYRFSVTAAEATALLSNRFTLQFGTATALAATPGLTASAVSVYPNPAQGRFTVRVPAVAGASQVQAELLNALGQVVHRQAAALPVAGATLVVETAGLAAGVYTLRLVAGASTLAKRVVLQ